MITSACVCALGPSDVPRDYTCLQLCSDPFMNDAGPKRLASRAPLTPQSPPQNVIPIWGCMMSRALRTRPSCLYRFGSFFDLPTTHIFETQDQSTCFRDRTDHSHINFICSVGSCISSSPFAATETYSRFQKAWRACYKSKMRSVSKR
jgi:hypothetical protein